MKEVDEGNFLGDMKRLKTSPVSHVNECFLLWYAQNVPIDGPVIREKAKYFADALAVEAFGASNSK